MTAPEPWVVSCFDGESAWLVGPYHSEQQAAAVARRMTPDITAVAMKVEPADEEEVAR